MKIIYGILCLIFMGIGFLGVALPILPTTPFLLIASYFGVRSSARFERWFKSTNLYQKHVATFIETRSMSRPVKTRILAFASSMLIVGFIMTPEVWAKILIICVMIVKYVYFYFFIETVPA